ncbi:AAA family ATPase [Lacticaseibacillus camelliae]|uniref:AAA family ATPase n=1 Tax=Lacticaseibacillus camelliae TaxID=381742 RepID=UPI0009EBE147|nr:AAA family ATPase [Lacticaseibacillus camelliae]
MLKKGMTLLSGQKDAKWWPIVFTGSKADAETPGSIVWQLRPGLKGALERAADGGQRYWWLNANPKIWTFSLEKIGTTQSYTIRSESGHLRRIPQNFRDAKPGDKFIGYETSPTKQIVALGTIVAPPEPDTVGFRSDELLVNRIDYADIKADPDLANMEFFKNPNGSLFKLTKDEYETILDLVRDANPDGPKKEIMESYSRAKFLEDVFIEPTKYDSLVALLDDKLNVILQGAPGVGKTYSAKRLAWSILSKKDDSHITMVEFHQNYAYEDFVIGYRPQEDGGFKLTEGKFVKACRQAQSDPDEKYFFIIDEINRGNLSKIFGELLMAIEKDYRGQPIPLAYGDKSLVVPKNLYIIGMMNTADRSLAIIDYALRRRFSFVDMEPAFETQSFGDYLHRMNNPVLDRIVAVVKQLNVAISKDEALGAGFEIGHSYFCNGENAQPGWLKRVVDFDLKPTLDEYWFDNQSTAEEWKKKLSDAVAEDSNNA